MKKLSMLVAVLLVFALASPLFAGGGGQKAAPQAGGSPAAGTAAAAPLTLNFTNWVSVEEGTQAPMVAMMDAYQRANPGITIRNQGIAVSDLVQQLLIMSAAGNSPDASQLHGDNVVQFKSAGYITVLDNLLSRDFVNDLYPDFYDVVGLVDGRHYAIPWANCTCGLMYNRKLMAQAGLDPTKPPTTVDELTQMMRTAKKALPDDIVILQLDTTVRTIGLRHQWPFMLAFNNGVEPYSLDGKVNYNTPGMKSYMEWLRTIVNEGLTLPGLRYGQFRPYGAQGKLLFANDGSYFDGLIRALDETKTLTPEIVYETYGATVLPVKASDGKARSAVESHTLVIFEGSKNKDAAAKFIEFVAGSQWSIQNYLAPQSFVPVTKSAFTKAPDFEKNQLVAAFVKDLVPTSVAMPSNEDFNQFAEVIMTGVQEVITTTRSIDDILADGQRKLEALFK